MEIPILITIFLTFISPFATAYINKVTWSSETKNLVAIVISLVIAVGYLIMTGGIADWSQLGVVVPAVYGLQNLVYQHILKIPAKKLEASTRAGSVIVAPSDATPGKVTVTTDESIKNSETIESDVPLRITAGDPIQEIKTTTPRKG